MRAAMPPLLESAAAADEHIEACAATEKHQRGPKRIKRMKCKLQTKAGLKTPRQFKAIAEPVFGPINQGRWIPEFLFRGLRGVCSWQPIRTRPA